MSEPRRQTKSVGTRRRDQQSDAQIWSNQPDPVLIERGQSEAIQLVRNTVNLTTANHTDAVGELMDTDASRVLCMVFVDEEGLEEQFLTEMRQAKKCWTLWQTE